MLYLNHEREVIPMKTKTFGHNKGYAINYLKKIRTNNKISFSMMAFGQGGWTIWYQYKNLVLDK